MKKFLIGVVAGVILTVVSYFFLYPSARLRVNIGRLLDEDIFYLKSGQVIRGWLVKEEGDKILIDIDKGSITLNRSNCREIKENAFLCYIRQLM